MRAAQATPQPAARSLAVITGGVSERSSTRLLADQLAKKSGEQLRTLEPDRPPPAVAVVDLAPLAVDIARATVTGLISDELAAGIGQIGEAHALIACSPVYKAGLSGLFKSFVDLLVDDLLIARPVVLAATAGSSRHALVVDAQMRPLFTYMRALVLPTSLFAASEDWAAADLSERITRSAVELAVAVHAGVEHAIAERAWSSYRHEFRTGADQELSASAVDFDSPLMRLAAGGAGR